MATLMKLGSLPPAKDPDHPTAAERAATDEKLAEVPAHLPLPLMVVCLLRTHAVHMAGGTLALSGAPVRRQADVQPGPASLVADQPIRRLLAHWHRKAIVEDQLVQI